MSSSLAAAGCASASTGVDIVEFVSFSNHARRVRDTSLPYGKRVSSLRSCVERYRPIGYFATLSYLESVAGPFQRDEAALLRALDVLDTSRQLRYAAHLEYASRRREEKREGQRSPRKGEPDPARLGLWFGAVRAAALHKLHHWSQPARRTPSGLEALRTSPEPWAPELASLITACIESGGHLSPEQRRALGAVVATLDDLVSPQTYDRDPTAYHAALRLREIARFVAIASEPF